MKILSLSVKGFRSVADVKWRPGDLNILIGPNASGKSNLLPILEMLSASAQGKLENYVRREGGPSRDGSAEGMNEAGTVAREHSRRDRIMSVVDLLRGHSFEAGLNIAEPLNREEAEHGASDLLGLASPAIPKSDGRSNEELL